MHYHGKIFYLVSFINLSFHISINQVAVNDAMMPLKLDVSQCCVNNNVSDACMDACSFDELNFQKVMDRDECIPDFSKLMKCAAGKSYFIQNIKLYGNL